MSWGPVAVTSTEGSALTDELDSALQALEDRLNEIDYELDDEAKAAAQEGIKAVQALADSGAFGGGPFNASISGHSNKNNKPDNGVSPDFISISFQSTDVWTPTSSDPGTPVDTGTTGTTSTGDPSAPSTPADPGTPTSPTTTDTPTPDDPSAPLPPSTTDDGSGTPDAPVTPPSDTSADSSSDVPPASPASNQF